MTSNENQKGFWHGALLLTAVALFMKILSVGYRIPYQNITGDIGFYVYQQIYPFYSIAIILATYGFPVVISRLVAEQMARNNTEKAEEISRYSFYVLTLLGLVGFVTLYMGAPALADLMDDPRLLNPLRATAFSFLIMPGIASIRGYFQGHENVIPTAWSQVTEQTVRVIAILTISIGLVSNGYGAYATGTGAALGSILGGVAALVLLVVLRIKGRKIKLEPHRVNPLRFIRIAHRLLTEGTLICVSALVMVLFQLMDALTIVSGLSEYGLSSIEARETKGIFDRGQPLLQVGTVLATSLSLSIVPVISKATAEKNTLLIHEKAGLSLKISFVIGLSAAAGLASIMDVTNIMLFTDDSLSRTLSFLAVSILFSSLAMTAAGILQGVGLARKAARYAGIGILLKGFLNIVLVPILGIDGAAIATVIGLATVALLTILAVHSKIGLIQYPFHIGRAIIAVAIMSSAVIVLQILFPSAVSRSLASFSALGGAVVGACVLGLSILILRVFTDKEIVQLPKGEKVRILQNKLRKGV
ncbi:putative polysaccharide biosynthesis protein [Pseudalkalibacillus hwajinpoensis]|uniref:Polysaccharide biosynthesis protein n=1 Tax=Guptibacillus hwajinpoensis TaxID=208199 RepID=A0A4U1M947_9BACL|nr:polysaccharide biosynthesis protein [Pseudalkalibacillus hwajinpoensis]TKD66933.1 polysaccharide biosynthesis protein [Pseudalkalibacillus hwajinpoensis]